MWNQLTHFIPLIEHLILGIVNHFFKASNDVSQDVEPWPRALHIKQEPYHGGQFIRNDCHKLFNNVDLLQRIAEQAFAFQILSFMALFGNSNQLLQPALELQFNDDFAKKIKRFKKSYLDLPRCSAHTVFYHIKQFIFLKKASQ